MTQHNPAVAWSQVQGEKGGRPFGWPARQHPYNVRKQLLRKPILRKHTSTVRGGGNVSQETENMKDDSQLRLGTDISMADLISSKCKRRWPSAGNMRRGRPKETWRRSLEREMKALGWSWGQVAKLAADRLRWRSSMSALCANTHEED